MSSCCVLNVWLLLAGHSGCVRSHIYAAGLGLAHFAIGASKRGGGGGLYGLLHLFFHTKLISLAGASWIVNWPLLANKLCLKDLS